MSFQATLGQMPRPAVIVLALVVVTVPIAWMSGEWSAWMIMYASIVSVLLLKSTRRDLALGLAMIAVVVSHHIVSLVNVYWTVLPGAEIDAVTFHSQAKQLAIKQALYFDIGYEFYENLLGVFYSLLGSSVLLGQALSILVFSLSCVVLVYLLDMLEIRRHRWVMMLAYGLLPSTLLITSFTLREAWELLFFMATVVCALRFVANRDAFWGLAMFVCAAGLALFHKALTIYSACFVVMVLWLGVWGGQWRFKSWRRLAVFAATSLLCVALALVAIQSTEVGRSLVQPLLDRGITDYIHAYRMQIDFLGSPRTAYGVMLDGTTLASTLLSFGKLYFYYLFAPITGSINSFKGGYALVEALVRAALILSSIVTWSFARTQGERGYGVLLLAYASMTFLWALGTTNVGQALRHHVLTSWILVLAGLPAILSMVEYHRECLADRCRTGALKKKRIGVSP